MRGQRVLRAGGAKIRHVFSTLRPPTLRRPTLRSIRPGAVLRRTGRLSLRARLLALTLVLVTTGLVVSDVVVLGTVREQLTGRLDQQLERFGTQLAHRNGQHQPGASGQGRFGPPTEQQDPDDGPKRLQSASGLPSEFEVRMLAADGSVVRTYRQPIAASDPEPDLSGVTKATVTDHLGRGFDLPGGRDTHWRALVLPIQRANPPAPGTNPSSYVMVASSLDDVNSTVSKLGEAFLAIGGAVLLLIAGLGAFAVRAGLKPLRRIEDGTELIAAGELSYRMPELPRGTEVGRLSLALNGMLDQIESAFAAQAASEARMRRFVADASHELRTPLAGIRGFAELYRMGALASDLDVKRTMDRIESEAVRMGGLVEDLLTLARLDEERPLDLAPMDLRTLAADALHDLTALDPTRPVSLTGPGGSGSPGAAAVLGDEARLRQVVTNLVGNAVKHTPRGTAVRIGVGTGADGCVLEVADSGPGLTQDQAERVFERFYRVDASRSRHDGGGAGLGLAIATAFARAHGGALVLHTGPGTGATFRLTLPRSSGD
ncbi:HAMP domain-containing histidine kinase [Kitasatospora sp. NBC_01287]|uniref:sensor histidine kinase n=1 Tax=Kitasatospora sp. NBC_01287 TaxID=2903573 RepID=UPI0022518490|nr:HAMP domain-containing sensor histidine kinase [Kitasatospora sp. NBC_01287]MCX4747812.1 HAMP domain-containing histidine kinase [Kitasatospora sp. NBC_01287]